MKIAILNVYQKKINRGAETFVSELEKRLSKKHKVDIFSSDKVPPRRWRFFWRAYLDQQGISIGLFTLKILIDIWRNKYDIVIPLNSGWQPAFIRIVTWLYGGKLVISGQSGIGWDDRNNLWCFPDAFISLSTKAKNWAHKANPFLKRIYYIPNGVDLEKFNPKGGKYPTNLDKPIVLCVGALEDSKRIDLVINAVSRLKNTSLLIAGDGVLKNKLVSHASKSMKDRVSFISVKHKEMPKVYRAADVFVLTPKEFEAFGIVYVEALASNIPTISLDDKQRREIIGNAGLYIKDPSKVDDFSKVIKKALNEKWGDKPRKRAGRFSWNEITKKYEKIFYELIK